MEYLSAGMEPKVAFITIRVTLDLSELKRYLFKTLNNRSKGILQIPVPWWLMAYYGSSDTTDIG
jgi:hypothetical protein